MEEEQDREDINFQSPGLTREEAREVGALILQMKKKSWIRNVGKIYNISEEEATNLYNKIDPYGYE